MSNAKTYVIRLTREGGSGAFEEISYSPDGNLTAQQGKINQKPSKMENIAQIMAVKVGTEALQYGLRNYGELTGDYLGQQTIEIVTGLASDVFMIAKGGWVGAAAVGIKYATQGVSKLIDYSKSRTKASMLQERLGLTNIRGW